jgi:gluconate 2-dehydrogenase gamma chain
MKITRRQWILGSLGAAAWTAIVSAQDHAHNAFASSSTSFEFFDPATAADVSAMAARIVPSDDGPGAVEAGAVFFIDRAMVTFASEYAAPFREGLADLKQRREKMYPGTASFAALTTAQQDELLHSVEKTPFFDLLRAGTVLAWLGPQQYGGNRNGVGWKYIGFDDAGFFEPPFGYYDAEAK